MINHPFGTGVYQLLAWWFWGTVYGIVLSTFDVLRGIVEIYDNGIDWDEFDHRRTMRSLEWSFKMAIKQLFGFVNYFNFPENVDVLFLGWLIMEGSRDTTISRLMRMNIKRLCQPDFQRDNIGWDLSISLVKHGMDLISVSEIAMERENIQ